MAEPAAKRARHPLQSESCSSSKALHVDAIRRIIATYLTIPELVLVRRVSFTWNALFSEAVCWEGRHFAPTLTQLKLAGSSMRLDAVPHLPLLQLVMGSGSSIDAINAVIEQLMKQLAVRRNMALTELSVDANVDAAVLTALQCLTELTTTSSPWKTLRERRAQPARGVIVESVKQLQLSQQMRKLHVTRSDLSQQWLAT